MPRRDDLHSILIIGSGPIVIGQACEFDYSGTQACRVLKAEGYRVVLANSNPATIMTDPDFADATYIEPLTWEVLASIIERERPDAVLPTLGGQTGLNVAMELYERGLIGVPGTPEMIGANAEAIATAEDRAKFKEAMVEIGLDVPRSGSAHTMDEARLVMAEIGLPVIIRPAYILGGRGTGIAATEAEFESIAANGLSASPISEILIEESIAGWKEFELEVMRDRADNCVIICSIENVDPMGIHTGDSITVAPQQTLSDVEYQQMRDAAIACIRRVGVETGGSNVQFAVDPGDRPPGRDRDEPACLAQLGAGVEGDRLPDRQDRRQARRRLHARRDPERHHADDAGQLRADDRLRRHQDPALGVREAAGHERASSAPRCSRWARRCRSGAPSPRACRRDCARSSRDGWGSTATRPPSSSRRTPTTSCST